MIGAEPRVITRITTTTSTTTVATTTTVEDRASAVELDDDLLRAMLRLIPSGDGYGTWWSSAAGIFFHEILTLGLGRSLSAYLWRSYAQRIDPVEVADTGIEILSDAVTLLRIAKATEPCAYLYTALKNELTRRAGQFFRVELEGNGAPELQYNDAAVSGNAGGERSLTPVGLAERLTVSLLLPHTPPRVLPHLAHLVQYFVEHGQAHVDAAITRAAVDPELLDLGLAASEIRAVGNAVLGSRPNHGTNSLLGEIIRDEEFDPAQSVEHSAAIAKYQRRIRGFARK